MFSTSDTIVAIATPHGRGGIGVVRLSGRDANRIAGLLLRRRTPLPPRRATFGVIRSAAGGNGRILDEVVATYFQAPRSYTGEDVIEIAAHGSPPVLQEIVEAAMRHGARLAEPGEFTLRAYLNGRIDLVQAEAVADLIEAVTPLQARAAVDQLQGTLTSTIGAIDRQLFDLMARLEASLDFPEEGFHFVTPEEARGELEAVVGQLDRLVGEGRRGRMIREGATIAIAGRPNVGKSSLFNALVGAERAIVTSQPGTTRDALTERIDLDGVAATVVDTAGLRETGDVVEREGVRRAREAQGAASLVLLVLDGSRPLTADDRVLLADAGSTARLVVINKSDLPAAWSEETLAADGVRVSARTGEGIATLRRRMVERLTGADGWEDPPAITNIRHLALAEEAGAAVRRALDAVDAGATEEVVLAELGAAREALEAITGRRAPDELLHHIFARFCIGK